MLSAAPRLLQGRIRGAAWGDRAAPRLPLPEEIRDGEEFLGRSRRAAFPAAQVPAEASHSSALLLLGHHEARSCAKHLANVLGTGPSSGMISSASPRLPPTNPTSCYKNHRCFLQPRSSRSNRQERRGLADSNTDVTLGRVRLKVFNQTSCFHIHFTFWFEIQSL